MSKPILSIRVCPYDATGGFVLTFETELDKAVVTSALDGVRESWEEVPPQLNGTIFAPWVRDIIKRGTNGDKIQAIKMVRIMTGAGLKEAKDFVEGYLL